jgi:hypothetical protein
MNNLNELHKGPKPARSFHLGACARSGVSDECDGCYVNLIDCNLYATEMCGDNGAILTDFH